GGLQVGLDSLDEAAPVDGAHRRHDVAALPVLRLESVLGSVVALEHASDDYDLGWARCEHRHLLLEASGDPLLLAFVERDELAASGTQSDVASGRFARVRVLADEAQPRVLPMGDDTRGVV